MNKFFNSALFFLILILNLQLRASDAQPIKALGEKNDLISALANAADFSNPNDMEKLISLMVKTFSIVRGPDENGPNNSKEFIMRHWQIAKKRASSAPHASTCINLLKEGYESIVFAFDHPQTEIIPEPNFAMDNDPLAEYGLDPIAFLNGHSPLVALLAKLVDFHNLSPQKFTAIIRQVPFKCTIDESVEHHPLLEELKEVYRKNSMALLITALKMGSLCVRTRITEKDIEEYSISRLALSRPFEREL